MVRLAQHALVLMVVAPLILASCGTQPAPAGARLTASSGQPCADKWALAINSGQPVSGAWKCLDSSLQQIYSGNGVKSDADIPHWLNPDKYMETVKFVAHHSLYGSDLDSSYYLYRVEGHPSGAHIVGYTEVKVDEQTGLVSSEDTTYCKPQGDLICTNLPT